MNENGEKLNGVNPNAPNGENPKALKGTKPNAPNGEKPKAPNGTKLNGVKLKVVTLPEAVEYDPTPFEFSARTEYV